MKNRTITLREGDAALVIDKNCTSIALHEDKDTGEIGENTYLLMSLVLASIDYKLMTKILDHAEKLLKEKDFKDIIGLTLKKKGKKR
jgi:hypothetical protein